MPKKLTQEEFIEKAKLKHGDKFDYSLVEYKNAKTKVKIICPNNHVFEQSTDSHLRGRGCLICKGHNKTTEEIINIFKNTHGNRYDYSLVNYRGSHSKVKIMCKVDGHGIFEQKAIHHINGIGCPKCNGKNKTTEDIIKEFKSIHGDKYGYKLVRYVNCELKVKIICPIHNVFEQRPSDHLNNKGCKKCANESIAIIKREKPTGWNITSWEKLSKISKTFDSFKVYIIICYNDNEEFYKIGRTFSTVKYRFKNKKSMPYKYKVIDELIFETAKEAFNKESELKRLHKDFKYLPLIKFGGMHECFSYLNYKPTDNLLLLDCCL